MSKTRAKDCPVNVRVNEESEPTDGPSRMMEPVRQPLPRCVYCEATTLTVIKKISEQSHCGTTIEGERYTSIIRRRVRCDSCGRCQIHVHRPYNPSKWLN